MAHLKLLWSNVFFLSLRFHDFWAQSFVRFWFGDFFSRKQNHFFRFLLGKKMADRKRSFGHRYFFSPLRFHDFFILVLDYYMFERKEGPKRGIISFESHFLGPLFGLWNKLNCPDKLASVFPKRHLFTGNGKWALVILMVCCCFSAKIKGLPRQGTNRPEMKQQPHRTGWSRMIVRQSNLAVFAVESLCGSK